MNRDGRFLITYSNLKYRQNDYSQALQLLEEAESFFCDITLHLKLAKLYEIQNLYYKAIEHYDVAINLSPDNIVPVYEKVLFLQRIGEDEKANIISSELLNKPFKKELDADQIIIKNRLKKFIANYREFH